MNQLLVALCLIGGIWYLVSANPKGNENADRSLVSEQVSALIPTEQDKAYPDQLAPISPLLSYLGTQSYQITPLRRWRQAPSLPRNQHSPLSQKSGLHQVTGFK